MKLGKRLAAAMALVAMAGWIGAAPADEAKTGIKVGEKAPNFKLMGADGAEHELSAMLEKGNVAVVFFRSANW